MHQTGKRVTWVDDPYGTDISDLTKDSAAGLLIGVLYELASVVLACLSRLVQHFLGAKNCFQIVVEALVTFNFRHILHETHQLMPPSFWQSPTDLLFLPDNNILSLLPAGHDLITTLPTEPLCRIIDLCRPDDFEASILTCK